MARTVAAPDVVVSVALEVPIEGVPRLLVNHRPVPVRAAAFDVVADRALRAWRAREPLSRFLAWLVEEGVCGS